VSGAVDLPAAGRAVRAWFEEAGTVLQLRDRATGEVLPMSAKLAGDPSGLLPVFLVAGEAVWREAAGKGFGLRIRRDPMALLGYRAEGIGNGTFCTVMLSTMEAVAQAQDGQPGWLLVNELCGAVWQAVLERADHPGVSVVAPAAPVATPPAPGHGAHP